MTTMKAKISVTIEEITPEIAWEMLKLNTANRRMSQSSVNKYAKQMLEGRWKTTSQGIAISSDNRIIDGQHRLMAIIKTKTSQKMMVTRGLDYEEVFAAYDTGTNRTAGDVLSIKGVDHHTTVAAALKVYIGLLNKNKSLRSTMANKVKASNEEIMDLYFSEKDTFDNTSEDVLKGVKRKGSLIPISLALGISFYLVIQKKHSIDKVRSFFIQVINGYPIENQTIAVLRSKISEVKTKKQQFNREDHLIYLKKTWNNFIQGREVSKFYISTLDRERDFI